MSIVTFRIDKRQQFTLRRRTEDLLTAGHDEASAAPIMVIARMGTAPIAKYICAWGKVYAWRRFKRVC